MASGDIRGLVCDHDGGVVAVSTHAVYRILEGASERIAELDSGLLSYEGVALGPNGRVWFGTRRLSLYEYRAGKLFELEPESNQVLAEHQDQLT